ncbi:trans-sialidase [Trypanosoma cruzi cruzi]|nr:trans-sialidase [Trypanosoma cruzi cruzi]PBJ70965.1 trans-sialidase [Trypanosoma cruzi cruzi]
MGGWGSASACVSLGDCLLGVFCVRYLFAAGLWPCSVDRGIELEAVAVCAFVVWRAESPYPRTDSTAMVPVCVCEGWCGRRSSVLFLPDCLVSRSLRGCSALVSTKVSDVLPLLLSSPLLEHTLGR